MWKCIRTFMLGLMILKSKLALFSLSEFIDPVAYEMAVDLKNGIPTNVNVPEKIPLERASTENREKKDEPRRPSGKTEINLKNLKAN